MAETGSLSPARQGGRSVGKKLALYRDLPIGWVERDGEISMPELAGRLARERQAVVHSADPCAPYHSLMPQRIDRVQR